jgi:CubicO group peptidase (beta-lactamase class C family)
MPKRSALCFLSRAASASILILLALAAWLFGTETGAQPGDPDVPWETCAPEEVGIDSNALADMLDEIKGDELEIRSIIIVRDGKLVLEAYVYPYSRNVLHNVKSVSKSVISALVGIALREGVIGSLEETVYEHFPQYITDDMDPRKKNITLRNLLTMTSGMDLDENGPISDRIFGSVNWIETGFERPMRDDPGTVFLYSTILTHTMSGILTEASGMSLREFADLHLFGPLGFGEVVWAKGPQGYNFGGAELFLRPLDMAKFGFLYENGGTLGGREIVPAGWVAESTGNRLEGTDEHKYGYWWWLGQEDCYRASGWGGQTILVCGEAATVIVVTAADRQAPRDLLDQYVMPMLESRARLEPDPEGARRMERLVHELEHPESRPAGDLTRTAADISGRTFVMEWNRMGIENITLDFGTDSTFTLGLKTLWGEDTLTGGLDGVYRVSDVTALNGTSASARVALKGRWADDSLLSVKWAEIGNPVYMKQDFRFIGDEVLVSVELKPAGGHLTLNGAAE